MDKMNHLEKKLTFYMFKAPQRSLFTGEKILHHFSKDIVLEGGLYLALVF